MALGITIMEEAVHPSSRRQGSPEAPLREQIGITSIQMSSDEINWR